MPTQPGFNPQWQPNQPPGGGYYGPPQQGFQPRPAPKRKKKWPFIVFGVVGLLLIAFVIRFVYVSIEVANRKASEASSEPSSEATVDTTTAAPTSEPSPPKPGAPVPCDPRIPAILCFPKDYNPEAVMDGVATEGWTCLRKGEPKEIGGTVSAVRECEARDNAGQPYSIRATISYDTHTHKPDGGLWSFDLHVITSAASSKGEHTTEQDATNALITAFEITAKHIWRDHPEHLKEATEAFEQLKPQCASPAGHTIQGVTATMPSGYEITCSSTTPIAVADVVTYDQSLEIRAA
ncbi:hypothetical protein [Saccharopolyspora sp. 5N708]|uniref:hypothetical protein n=1 Tax=Saccharopolyspora sp. 5N708 TaxID=3457424 RepID=UPI003FD47905